MGKKVVFFTFSQTNHLVIISDQNKLSLCLILLLFGGKLLENIDHAIISLLNNF